VTGCLLALSLLLAVDPSPASLAQARKHFEAGRRLYEASRFADAIAELEAGFALSGRALFLFNIGQANLKLADATAGDRRFLIAARDAYQHYLEAAGPKEPEKAEAQVHLAQLEQRLSATAAPALAPPILLPNSEATLVPVVAEPPAAIPAAERSWQPWIIGAAAAVVAAGVGTGIYFGTRPSGCTATIGCLDAR
jgi:hypothetical protein